jgi:hypothetical protein
MRGAGPEGALKRGRERFRAAPADAGLQRFLGPWSREGGMRIVPSEGVALQGVPLLQ